MAACKYGMTSQYIFQLVRALKIGQLIVDLNPLYNLLNSKV